MNNVLSALGLVILGASAGCASHSSAPPNNASSATVEQATDNPTTGPSFAPASNDGTASAPSNRSRANGVGPQSVPPPAGGNQNATPANPPASGNY